MNFQPPQAPEDPYRGLGSGAPPPGYPPPPYPPPAYQPWRYPPPPDPNDGRTIQTIGYVFAGVSVLIPFVGLVGLILGIITATKPRRGGHGAAIIALSVVLAVVGWFVWAAIFWSGEPSYGTGY